MTRCKVQILTYSIFYFVCKGSGIIKRINMIDRQIKDYEAADKCHTCCLCCKEYKTVKEQNKLCEVRKARARIINRKTRESKKVENSG